MADVKNYGLKGIGNDVQLGKKGGRFQYADTGGGDLGTTPVFSIVDEAGSTLQPLKIAQGFAADEAVTKAQLDSVSVGITVKESVVAVTDTDLVNDEGAVWTGSGRPFAASTPTAAEVGEFTNVPLTLGGVTLAVGDRVLVRVDGVTGLFSPSPTIGSGAERNGIYVVTAVAATVTMRRADDNGGDLSDEGGDGDSAYLRNDADLAYGDYAYCTGGTYAGNAYISSNYFNVSNPDAEVEPKLNINSEEGYVVASLFTQATTYDASDGIRLDGNTFVLDIDSLDDATTSLSSTIAFGDGTPGGTDEKSTLQDVFNTHNVVYGLADNTVTGTGFVGRAGEDIYYVINFDAATDGGIAIDGTISSNGTLLWSLDFDNLPDAGTVDNSYNVALSDGTNVHYTTRLLDIINDLDIVTATGGTGGIYKTASDTYETRTLQVNTGVQNGLSVVDGNGVAGNPTFGLDIDGMTDAGSLELTDTFPVYDVSQTKNNKATIQDILDLVTENVTDNEIAQDDSKVEVVDDGVLPGVINFIVDGQQITQMDLTGTRTTSIGVDDLGATHVVLGGGPGGQLNANANLTFDGLNFNVNGNAFFDGDGQFDGQVTCIGLDAGTGNITGADLTVLDIVGTSLDVGAGAISGGPGSFSTITGTSLDVGSGDISGGAISGSTLTLTGTLTAGDITVGNITGTSLDVGGGNITGGATFVGDITGTSLDLGLGSITAGNITVGNINAADIVGDSLNVGTGTITGGDTTVGDIIGTSIDVGSGAITGGPITGTSLDVGVGTIDGGNVTVLDIVGTSLNVGTGNVDGGNASFLAITGSSLDVGTGTITGGALDATTGDFTGKVTADELEATTNGITDQSLSGNGSLVWTDNAKRLQDAGNDLRWDDTTNTLFVNNLSVSGESGVGGINDINESEIAFGDTGGGSLAGDAAFTYSNPELTINQLVIDGVAQTISGNVVDGDISIIPDGDGEVVIGSAGNGVISADTGQTLTIQGDTGLVLATNSGSVVITDNDLGVAQFDALTNADVHFTFQSDVAANGLKLGTSGATDIRFLLSSSNLLRIDDEASYLTALGTVGDDTINPDALVTKEYVDIAAKTITPEGGVSTKTVVVDLAVDGQTNIGDLLPESSMVMAVYVKVTTAADAGTTLSVGTSADPDRYMTIDENDVEINGLYTTDNQEYDATTVQLVAEVANSGVAGVCSVQVQYRTVIEEELGGPAPTAAAGFAGQAL